MSMEIRRKLDKINILEQILENGEFVIIGEGDIDYPKGLKFPLPEEWKRALKLVIRELKADLRRKVDEYTAEK